MISRGGSASGSDRSSAATSRTAFGIQMVVARRSIPILRASRRSCSETQTIRVAKGAAATSTTEYASCRFLPTPGVKAQPWAVNSVGSPSRSPDHPAEDTRLRRVGREDLGVEVHEDLLELPIGPAVGGTSNCPDERGHRDDRDVQPPEDVAVRPVRADEHVDVVTRGRAASGPGRGHGCAAPPTVSDLVIRNAIRSGPERRRGREHLGVVLLRDRRHPPRSSSAEAWSS